MVITMRRRRRETRCTVGAIGVGIVLLAASCSGGNGAEGDASPVITTRPTTTATGSSTPHGSPASTAIAATSAQVGGSAACAEPAGRGAVDVTIWSLPLGGSPGHDTLSELADEFHTTHPDITVHVDVTAGHPDAPPDPEETVRAYFRAYAAGSAVPDALVVAASVVGVAIDSGAFTPVAACLDGSHGDLGDFLPKALATTERAGIQWGWPVAAASPLEVYETGALARAGIESTELPRTLEELGGVAGRLASSGVLAPINSPTLSFDAADGTSGVVDGGDGHVVEPTRITLSETDLAAALRGAQQVVGPFVDLSDEPPEDAFASGRSAIATSYTPALNRDVDLLDAGAASGITLAVAPVPSTHTTRTVVSTLSAMLSSASTPERRAAVWDFLRWLSEPQQQSALSVASGWFPMRRDAVSAQPLADRLAGHRVLADAWAILTADDAVPAAIIGPSSEIDDAISGALGSVLHGGDPESAAADAIDTANRALTDYARDPLAYGRCFRARHAPLGVAGC